MTQEPRTGPDEPGVPVLSPPRRGANWRVTGLAAGVLLVLVLLKVATSHPQPNASHASPAGAAVGYIDALRTANLTQLKAYLSPAERSQAGAELRTLQADHVLLVSPVVDGALGQGRSRTVAVTIEVCYRSRTDRPYSCRLLQHQPLGLPPNLQSVEVGGRWFISTLLEPQPLG
ncbi:MAG: hypothetical protein ACYCYK_01115 [Candidatus Dormibacteria bacterium]